MKLSPKKQRFVEFIENFIGDYDRSPTFTEMMEGLKIKSLGTINWYVKELEKSGAIRRAKGFNGKRGLEIVGQISETSLPLLGQITAGYPLEEVENLEYIEVPPSFIHPENYVLKVNGDSMIDDNIQEGDYVVIRKKTDANSGDTVVAFVNEEATLKRYYPAPTGIELHPRNPEYDVIRVGIEDDFRIGGIVLFVFRMY